MWEGFFMSIRAIIGTVAVLAGFAVLEHSVDASTGQAGSCKPAQAYALLHRGEALPVRAQPTPEAPVVGSLTGTGGSDGALQNASVVITASQSGWARISLVQAKGFATAEPGSTRQYGWVPADALAVDGRVDGAITTYSRPGLMGYVTGHIENEDGQFRVLGCRGEWLQVINEAHGNTWIDKWCAREEGCRRS
jgi:hypothetical protein